MDINIECETGKTGETGERILDCELGRIVNWAQATSLRQRGEEGKELPLNKEKDKRYKLDKYNDCQKNSYE